MDYDSPSYASVEGVEGIDHDEVVAGEASFPCYDVDDDDVDVVVDTSFVVVVVGTSFVAAAVVEPSLPFEHSLEVLCSWTLQTDRVDYNDQMGFVQSFLHVHNLHFEVGVVFLHVRLRINCLVTACRNHRPESKNKVLRNHKCYSKQRDENLRMMISN